MKLFRFAFVLIVLACTHAHAEPYFKGNSVPSTLIDAPLAPGTDEWRREIGQILAMQKDAQPQDIAQARDERDLKPELVAEIIPSLTRQSSPATYKLLDKSEETAKAVTNVAKAHWNTRRPFIMDERIKALISPHNNPAYPSGHTSGSYVFAYVLALLMPEEREHLVARADTIAQHRVLAGMHYPHDIQGGKQLALIILGGLLQNPQFQNDLAAAREELQGLESNRRP